MEYKKGQNLEDILKQNPRFEMKESVDILKQIYACCPTFTPFSHHSFIEISNPPTSFAKRMENYPSLILEFAVDDVHKRLDEP